MSGEVKSLILTLIQVSFPVIVSIMYFNIKYIKLARISKGKEIE